MISIETLIGGAGPELWIRPRATCRHALVRRVSVGAGERGWLPLSHPLRGTAGVECTDSLCRPRAPVPGLALPLGFACPVHCTRRAVRCGRPHRSRRPNERPLRGFLYPFLDEVIPWLHQTYSILQQIALFVYISCNLCVWVVQMVVYPFRAHFHFIIEQPARL
jgi:hypothetical protein